MKIISLATRQDCDRNLVRLRRRKNKDDVCRWFLKCLKQRIERSRRKHMYLINDIDLILAFRRAVRDLLPDLTDIVYTVI